MKITLPAAGAIKMKTAFIRWSSQVDKMHQQKQKWSTAFKQVCLEAQKMKTAKLAGAVGPFPSVELLCEAKNIKLAMGVPRVVPSSVYAS
jgi:hypothetical protein